MEEIKHSPAPWRLSAAPAGPHIILDALGDSIAALARSTGDHPAEEQAANAALIAAAPELLARLEASTKTLIAERDALYDGATTRDGHFDHPDDAAAVAEMDAEIAVNRAVIARARGETS